MAEALNRGLADAPERAERLGQLRDQLWQGLQSLGGVKLNGSAGAILNQVDGQRTVADIVASLEQQFPDAGPLGKDVSEFLQDARHQHWIELS